MFQTESQPTSPEQVVNGLPEPALRELLPVLRDWLDAQRDESTGLKFMRALVGESIKLDANAKGLGKLEFDAQELTEACVMPEQGDYEASALKVKNADLFRYMKSRRPSLEAFFEQCGLRHALELKKHSPGGRHRAQWFLQAYALDRGEELGNLQPGGQLVEAEPVASTQRVQYHYAEAGSVKSSWLARPLLRTGSFKLKSFRGLVFASTIIVPAVCVLLLAERAGFICSSIDPLPPRIWPSPFWRC